MFENNVDESTGVLPVSDEGVESMPLDTQKEPVSQPPELIIEADTVISEDSPPQPIEVKNDEAQQLTADNSLGDTVEKENISNEIAGPSTENMNAKPSDTSVEIIPEAVPEPAHDHEKVLAEEVQSAEEALNDNSQQELLGRSTSVEHPMVKNAEEKSSDEIPAVPAEWMNTEPLPIHNENVSEPTLEVVVEHDGALIEGTHIGVSTEHLPQEVASTVNWSLLLASGNLSRGDNQERLRR